MRSRDRKVDVAHYADVWRGVKLGVETVNSEDRRF